MKHMFFEQANVWKLCGNAGVLAKKELGGILAVFNFINKSCRGKPCGHSGIIIRSLSNNFTNEIIALNFI